MCDVMARRLCNLCDEHMMCTTGIQALTYEQTDKYRRQISINAQPHLTLDIVIK